MSRHLHKKEPPGLSQLNRVHTAPESVKRVKSSAQILDKSFFWRLRATNALGGNSCHLRTPFLTAVQQWSPLMTGATSKCICGVQPPEKWLNQNLFATFYSFNTFWSGVSSVHLQVRYWRLSKWSTMRKKLTDSKNKVMFYYFDCRFFKGLIILYQYVAMVEIGIIKE